MNKVFNSFIVPVVLPRKQQQKQQYPKLHSYLDRQKTIPCQRLFLSQTHSSFGGDQEAGIQVSHPAQWCLWVLDSTCSKAASQQWVQSVPQTLWCTGSEWHARSLGPEAKYWDRLIACNKTADSEAERFPPVCVGAFKGSVTLPILFYYLAKVSVLLLSSGREGKCCWVQKEN